MVAGRWQNVLVGVIMGVVAYVVVAELLDAFSETLGDGAGAELIETLVPIAIAIAVILFAFRGLGHGGGAMGGGF